MVEQALRFVPARELRGQLAYHARLLVRSPRAVAGGVLLPVVLLVVRGEGRDVAGLAVLGVLSTAFITHAGSLVTARQAGVLKRWRATPLPSWCWFAGRIGATVAVAVSGGVFTVFAGVALYSVHVDGALVAVLVLGALTWASRIGSARSCAGCPRSRSSPAPPAGVYGT